jgi:hypothetical protein
MVKNRTVPGLHHWCDPKKKLKSTLNHTILKICEIFYIFGVLLAMLHVFAAAAE